MKAFIVYAHHEPKSFNGAMLRIWEETLQSQGAEVRVGDLYGMGFDPVSDRRNFRTVHNPQFLKQQLEEKYACEHGGFSAEIEAELEKVEWCDLLVFQFPLWWFGLPAILKGWVDRVFVMGRVYGGGKWYDNGAFKGKRAMLSLTTGGPATMFSADGLMGDITAMLHPINHGILRFVGFDVLPPFVAWGAAHVTEEVRREYLEALRERIRTLSDTQPIPYPSLAEYDSRTWQRPVK